MWIRSFSWVRLLRESEERVKKMGNKQQAARAALHLSTSLGFVSGIVLLALAIWTLKDKAFLDELLRSRLYMDATYIILVVSAVLTILSCFGCFAARKEIKCFVLTYFVVLLLFTVVLVIGGVLAYVFREQVPTKDVFFKMRISSRCHQGWVFD